MTFTTAEANPPAAQPSAPANNWWTSPGLEGDQTRTSVPDVGTPAPQGTQVSAASSWISGFGDWERMLGQQVIGGAGPLHTGLTGPDTGVTPEAIGQHLPELPLPGGTLGEYGGFLRVMLYVAAGGALLFLLWPMLSEARRESLQEAGPVHGLQQVH